MEHLLKAAVQAALEAGREIMRIYLDPKQRFCIETKTDNSPLTRADKAAHRSIVSLLSSTGIPILSEEGETPPYETRREWNRLWLVDPLDGTKEFIKKNDEFTVNIALVEDGTPVLGVVYVPATGVFYAGAKGLGAYKGKGERSKTNPLIPCYSLLTTSPLPLLSRTPSAFTIVASRSHLSPETEAYIEAKRAEHSKVEVVSIGSSLKMCLVAEGTADEYPRFAPTMEWDTAAGDAIARTAGRKVVDARTGEPLTYNKYDLHNPWFVVR